MRIIDTGFFDCSLNEVEVGVDAIFAGAIGFDINYIVTTGAVFVNRVIHIENTYAVPVIVGIVYRAGEAAVRIDRRIKECIQVTFVGFIIDTDGELIFGSKSDFEIIIVIVADGAGAVKCNGYRGIKAGAFGF